MDDATQRIERRVNEITEMHRLNEDHFRQEWTAYKADDQKRWTNYNMVAEEQQKDLNRQFDKLDQRMLQLEDLTQQVSDHFDEMNEETQKRLRSLLDTAHSWLSSYERIFGKPSEQD
jgi:DNA-binding transcriptional MerR regulator